LLLLLADEKKFYFLLCWSSVSFDHGKKCRTRTRQRGMCRRVGPRRCAPMSWWAAVDPIRVAGRRQLAWHGGIWRILWYWSIYPYCSRLCSRCVLRIRFHFLKV
jgi:hypothetical protein